jgi:hypothetical protein
MAKTSGTPTSRPSRFVEGSMSDRSVAVASTWNENGLRLSESSERSAEDTDSDATPRASRQSHDSGSSFDVSDFQPVSAAPATIKGRLTKLVKRNAQEKSKPQRHEPKAKKGLRKSISTWNFHALGDKMRFFGASSSDSAEDAASTSSQTQPDNSHLAELNDRKRKAELAYAQQFGMKKQKSNDGLPVPDHRALRTPAQPRALKKRSVSGRSMHSSKPTWTQVDVPRPIDVTHGSSTAKLHDLSHDHRKQASRSELEKENQQLRALLREQRVQQVAVVHRSASKSNVHLPLDQDDAQVGMPLTTTDRLAFPFTSPGRPHGSQPAAGRGGQSTKRTAGRNTSLPPVPPLPSRPVLAALVNTNKHTTHTKAGDPSFGGSSSTVKRRRENLARPVSMILEEEDIENSNSGVVNAAIQNLKAPQLSPSPHLEVLPHAGTTRENWEWPEDVF